MADSVQNSKNKILSRCTPSLFPPSEVVTFRLGDVLLRPNQTTSFVFFPLTMMASFVRPLADGSTIEVGIAGAEGTIGLDALFGAEAQPNMVTVQAAGDAIRVMASTAKVAFDGDAQFRQLVLLFANAFAIQVGQTAACNRLHPLERRLARWLLMVDDRTNHAPIALTQEFLAQMLGTRTAGVNEAISTLTASGLIGHRRQLIEIIDRRGLEAESCECYAVVKTLYGRDHVM